MEAVLVPVVVVVVVITCTPPVMIEVITKIIFCVQPAHQPVSRS